MKVASNRVVARIFLQNIRHNIQVYKSIRKENVKICAVVKSDAYGHGSARVSGYIQDMVDYYAVATGDEALELRKNGIIKPILVLGYISQEEVEDLIENDIEFTVHNKESVFFIDAIAKKIHKVAKIHIKLDTGMSRIGFLPEEDYVSQILEIYKMSTIQIVGCFSHFADAENHASDFTQQQYRQFNHMCEQLEKVGINLGIKHIANSTVALKNRYDLDMVRIGIGIYGYADSLSASEGFDLKPAMRLETVISSIKKLDKGRTVSYARKYKVEYPQWIATIPIGYGDGIHRTLSNKKFEVVFKDKSRGIAIGNICMDQMMLKVSEKMDVGSEVFIFGYDRKSGYAISEQAGTIVYEILCSIHKRVKRVYETSTNEEDREERTL